eukprot:Hpha_TRINITY_DN30253_c0_g1::TRINITY_DN30253_c0_g1_i1::g.27092::m.27092
MPAVMLVWEGPQEDLQSDIEAAQSAMKLLRPERFNHVPFLISVVVTIVTAFVLGRFQDYCYGWQLAVYSLVLPQQIWEKKQLKQLFVLVEFGWAFSFLSFIYLGLITLSCPWVSSARLFACFSCFAFGPVGLSALWLGDALVLHDTATFAALCMHLFPMLTAWCVWWNNADLGSLFDAADLQTEPRWLVFQDSLMVYGAWWVLHTIWMLVHGKSLHREGHTTAYSQALLPDHPRKLTLLQKVLGPIKDGQASKDEQCDECKRVLKYEIISTLPTVATLILAAWLLHWRWMAGVFVLMVFFASVIRGAMWYSVQFKRLTRVVESLHVESPDPTALGASSLYGTMGQ